MSDFAAHAVTTRLFAAVFLRACSSGASPEFPGNFPKKRNFFFKVNKVFMRKLNQVFMASVSNLIKT